MSDSDSETSTHSDSLPSASVLEDALRSAVQNIYQSGNFENLTVKRVRRAAEDQLKLKEDYFKNDAVWKEKSKKTIQTEVAAHADPSSSQIPPREDASSKAPQRKIKSQTNGEKRRSAKKASSKNRQKTESATDGEDQERKNSDVEPLDAKVLLPSRTAEGHEGTDPGLPPSKVSGGRSGAGAEGSESEMSEVLDEAPKQRRKRKSSESEKAIPKKKSKTSKTSQAEQQSDPDTEEIKRLQGWLTKCGIRKMWWKELQPYDTPKAKIRHLKDMLAEAGMTGRYSAEKASQIREERELKADLDAVQAGNKQWGMEEAQDDGDGKPKRRLAKGLKELDFLNDDDGEETD